MIQSSYCLLILQSKLWLINYRALSHDQYRFLPFCGTKKNFYFLKRLGNFCCSLLQLSQFKIFVHFSCRLLWLSYYEFSLIYAARLVRSPSTENLCNNGFKQTPYRIRPFHITINILSPTPKKSTCCHYILWWAHAGAHQSGFTIITLAEASIQLQ